DISTSTIHSTVTPSTNVTIDPVHTSEAKRHSASSGSKSALIKGSSLAADEKSSTIISGAITTKWNTVTSNFSNTTTITSCPPESTTVVNVYKNSTSLVTKTICDTVCKHKKSEASAALKTFITTVNDGSVVTKTICDTVCKSKKSEASAAIKTSTYTVHGSSTTTETVCDEKCQSRKAVNHATATTHVKDTGSAAAEKQGSTTKKSSSVDTTISVEGNSYPSNANEEQSSSIKKSPSTESIISSKHKGFESVTTKTKGSAKQDTTGTTAVTKSVSLPQQQEVIAAAGKSSSTISIALHSENNAAKNFMGLGAGILAVGALLI
ncbi:hypothetical protein C6P44_001689, partial [Monosporozyma unispora]